MAEHGIKEKLVFFRSWDSYLLAVLPRLSLRALI